MLIQIKNAIVLATVTLGMLLAVTAWSRPQGPYLRGAIGISGEHQKTINDAIEDDEFIFRNAGFDVDFERLGASFYPLIECGIQLGQLGSAGLEFAFQTESAVSKYEDLSGAYSDRIDVSVFEAAVDLTWFVPGAEDAFFGLKSGIGFFGATDKLRLIDNSDPSSNYTASGDWSAIGPVAGGYFGLEHCLPSRVLVWGRLGYQYRKVARLEGTVRDSDGFFASRGPQNNAGARLNSDFSGFHLVVGLGLSFGTAP